MHASAVLIEGAKKLSLAEIGLKDPEAGDVVVRVQHSGISTGTEKLLWSGAMPPFPGLAYPLVPGYEAVGEVVDVKKKNHVAVLVKSEGGLKKGESLRLLSPEGREKFVVVDRMTNALNKGLKSASQGEIVLIPPIGGISVRSMVYRQ